MSSLRPSTIGPGAKASFIGCDVMADGTYGAAVVESADQPVIAIGKAYGAGLSTAFNGVDVGYQKDRSALRTLGNRCQLGSRH